MSDIQPSVIEQLIQMHNTFDALVAYETDTGGKDSDDYRFYLFMANRIHDKIQEFKK